MDLAARLAFAVETAEAAGGAILTHYGATAHALKEPGSPVTAADLAANRLIVERIRAAWPGEAVLAEESRDDPVRLERDLVWVVDPLDGTKEFLAGNGEFSVMIGLAWRGEAVLGVVHVPVWAETYEAMRSGGARVRRAAGAGPLHCATADPAALRMVGSRSHADGLTRRIADALAIRDVKPSGSVGIKCALIARGERDLYVHPVPYLREWDTCAPEVIAVEAGARVTDCRGAPLRYNKRDPVQPDGILVSGPGAADRVQEIVRGLYDEERTSGRTAAGQGG